MMFRDTIHYLNKRDVQYRNQYPIKELKIILLKSFIFDFRIKFSYRFILKNKQLVKLLKKNIRIRNRCILTGKSRFIFSYFHLNRSSLKLYSSFGFISGLQKW